MARDSIERLHYYQRQYLGADDFDAQQDYHRCMRQRHNLGPHTWGIVAGLELVEVEQEGGGGGVDVYVLPGLAVDGFGREIVVLAPAKLSGELFDPFAAGGAKLLPVWIGYDEDLRQRPRSGYELCDVEDQFARVLESYRFEIDPAPPFHDDLIVAGHALEPGVEPDPTAPPGDVSTLLTIPRDGSVPHQELPDDADRPRWLIQLGNVQWDGAKLVPVADPAQLTVGRSYLGAVAQEVLAPAGQLTLRHRRGPETLANKEEPDGPDDAEYGVQAVVAGSLAVERRVDVAQNLVVKGDAGIGTGVPDTRLHVDDGTTAALADGTGYAVIGDVDATNLVLDDQRILARDKGAAAALHLQSEGGDLVVHQNQVEARVVVKEGGQVGVGTLDPKVKLQIEGGNDAKLNDEEAGFLVIGSPLGPNLALDDNEIMARNAAGKSPLHLQADGGDVRIHNNQADTKVVVRDSGRVGVGTSNPEIKLHIEGGTDASLSNGSGYLLLGSVDDQNVVFDDNEIIARKDGSAGTLHVQAEGGEFRIHDREPESERVVVKDSGRVGIGTTNPRAKLQVEGGTDVNLGDDSGFLVLGSVDGPNLALDQNEIQARENGSVSQLLLQHLGGGLRVNGLQAQSRNFAVTANGSVGVGTSTPAFKLDVRGQVRGTGGFTTSDVRWKKSVTDLGPPLKRLASLRGVRFEWRRDEHEEMGFDEKPHFGLIAQEVEKVFPELVDTDDQGFKAVDTFGLVPVLLEAVKELTARNKDLEARVAALERPRSGARRKK